MNAGQFSKSAFEFHSGDPDAARGLADDLEQAVLTEVGLAARAKFRELVAALNAEGHRLTPHLTPGLGTEDAKDYSDPNQCALRLGVEVTVSAGYRDVRFEGGWGEPRN